MMSKIESNWLDVSPDHECSIRNLPYGICRTKTGTIFAATRLGDWVIDLSILEREGMFGDSPDRASVFDTLTLNKFMSQGPSRWADIRARLTALLTGADPRLRDDRALREVCLDSAGDVDMLMPVEIGDFTDFYSSLEHATNVGKMFRDASNPLLPNWRHIPIGYHGRCSSLFVSGAPVYRPMGQIKPDGVEVPHLAPTEALDFELEMGFFVGVGNEAGRPIHIEDAANHIFGMVLVNDWSARDIQKWEYVPLGPFLGKCFATSISPWVVPMAALEPFRRPNPPQDPPVLDYLRAPAPWALDVQLEVLLKGAGMKEAVRICRTNFRDMYWTVAQQLAHHTINGTPLKTGDLCASGTVSGKTSDSLGSLLELCWKGTRPLALPDGSTRVFLQDGDTVTLRGWCEGEGFRVGFGEVRGAIQPVRGPLRS